MIPITGKLAASAHCVYSLHDSHSNQLAFVWACKLANALSLRDILSNPAFNNETAYMFNIISLHKNQHDAYNAMSAYMNKHGMPELNKTIRYNRYSQVICDQTGQTFRNQLECAQMLGLNQAQLSQHLRRAAGYKTIKGMTFSNITTATPAREQPVQYPLPAMPAQY